MHARRFAPARLRHVSLLAALSLSFLLARADSTDSKDAAPSPAPVPAGNSAQTAPAASPSSATARPEESAPHQANKRIYVGMPAAELQKLIGKPDKVTPVEKFAASGGKGEVWIYRKLKTSSTETVTVGSRPVMGKRQDGNGNWVDVVLSNEPINRNKTVETYRVASFLIVNGEFVTSSQTEEKQESWQ